MNFALEWFSNVCKASVVGEKRMKLGQVNGLWIGVGLGRGPEVRSVKVWQGICSAWSVKLMVGWR